jgi:hypothetical protein
VAVSQEFGNARVPAHPFMRLALETNYQTVISILETSLKSIIEEIARQKMRNTGG